MNIRSLAEPANEGPAETHAEAQTVAKVMLSAMDDGPINILIVDDEPKNLTVLETILDDPGYRLVRAESADQALLALVVEQFALIILDIRMPGMTGFELAQMIKERKKTAQVPIIFLTAYFNEDQHILEGYGTGAVDYLHKPVNPVILRSKVSIFAELHRKNYESAMANRVLLAEVAERRRAEEQLRELNENLEQRVMERSESLAQANFALKQLNASLEQQVTERTQTLLEREERLRAILNTAADAIITFDLQGRIQSINPATEQMFGYTASEMIGQKVKLLMASPYREEHDRYLDRFRTTAGVTINSINREVVAQRKDGSRFPVELVVSTVNHIDLFTGILRDVSRRKELEQEVVEIASEEQRRIGQDLHDSVGQELTALNILAGDLSESLDTTPLFGSRLVQQIIKGLQRCQHELRTVMRGLLPVAVDSEGLMAALFDLADRTEQEGKVNCTFDCPKPVAIADNVSATQVYLIAHESVHNAVKHSQARNIRISLTSNDLLVLLVQDDGIGLPDEPSGAKGGLGLRIMRNRAAIIGATLTIQSTEPTGTLVSCTLVNNIQAGKQAHEITQLPDRL